MSRYRAQDDGTNQKLTELLRNLSFTSHTLNAMIELAVSADHDTRRLERIISLIEQDLRLMRYELRVRYELRQPEEPEVATD